MAAGADVWQVIEVAKVFAAQPADAVHRAAEWLGLSPGLVQTAIAYYAEQCDEIELMIRRNAEVFAAAHGELYAAAD